MKKVILSGKLILYIACSLDGYIADVNGGIGFLDETPATLSDLGYDDFYKSIGTIIIGGKTYRQVKYELSPNEWMYKGKNCYVYSHQQNEDDPNVRFTNLPPSKLLEHIRQSHGGDIWLMGGSEIVHCFMQENLIDEYYIYFMPNLLGEGIPLFHTGFPSIQIELKSAKVMKDVVEMIYCKRMLS